MKLLIDGLEKKDGYFEMPFEAYGILGEDREKLIIIGNDLEANFEISMLPQERGRGKCFVIYQTPSNFMYNTLGCLAKLRCTNKNNGVDSFYQLEDLDKIEVLSIETKYEGEVLVRTMILKISLTSEKDHVKMIVNDGEYCTYMFSANGVDIAHAECINLEKFESIALISYRKMEKEFEKVTVGID